MAMAAWRQGRRNSRQIKKVMGTSSAAVKVFIFLLSSAT
jgi:hypothetical protein